MMVVMVVVVICVESAVPVMSVVCSVW